MSVSVASVPSSVVVSIVSASVVLSGGSVVAASVAVSETSSVEPMLASLLVPAVGAGAVSVEACVKPSTDWPTPVFSAQ
jgi:hypothetical protein